MKHESREEHIMCDEAGAGQRPMSRRDALKAVGLAGAAALSTAAVSWAQTADETPTAVQPRNPLRRRAERRDNVSTLLPSDALSRQQQHLLPGLRRRSAPTKCGSPSSAVRRSR